MAREREGVQEQLERLDAMFPGREFLERRDVIAFTGRGGKFVDKHVPNQGKGNTWRISKVKLARFLVE